MPTANSSVNRTPKPLRGFGASYFKRYVLVGGMDMPKFLFAAVLIGLQVFTTASGEQPKVRVMGMGIYTCNYWYTQVFRIVVNSKAAQEGKSTIYPFQSLQEWSAAMSSSNPHKQLYEESLDWISGYFAGAQRFGKLSATNSEQTSDVILTKVFEICRQHPDMKFEEAASIAVNSLLNNKS